MTPEDFGKSHINRTDWYHKYEDIAAARDTMIAEGFLSLYKSRWNKETKEFLAKNKSKELRDLFACMLNYFEYK